MSPSKQDEAESPENTLTRKRRFQSLTISVENLEPGSDEDSSQKQKIFTLPQLAFDGLSPIIDIENESEDDFQNGLKLKHLT